MIQTIEDKDQLKYEKMYKPCKGRGGQELKKSVKLQQGREDKELKRMTDFMKEKIRC